MRQHWVARSYLGAWAIRETAKNKSPLAWAFRCEDRKLFSPSVKNIFAEAHFYSIVNPDGTKDTSLERRLALLEREFIIARDSLMKGLSPTEEDEGVFASYAALMHARSKRMRDHHRSQFEVLARKMNEIEKVVRDGDKLPPAPVVSAQERRASVTQDQVNFVVRNTGAVIVPAFTRAEAMVYADMQRATLVADGKDEFITSDGPCVWLDTNAIPGFFGGPQLLSKGLEVYLPISPRLCLIWSHKRHFSGTIVVNDFVVQHINLWIAAQSEVLVSSRPLFARVLSESPLVARAVKDILRDRNTK